MPPRKTKEQKAALSARLEAARNNRRSARNSASSVASQLQSTSIEDERVS